MSAKPSLLVLAAGMGSRYGGLKQLDGFGPVGQTLMEYSVRDAARSGFGRAVFVIRRDFAEAFEKGVLAKLKGVLDLGTAFQDLNQLPAGHLPPPGREKPWGTAHAVLAAKDEISGPFVMVNADDFYGRASFEAMARFFDGQPGPGQAGMVGYRLQDTLSEHGGVTRAICELDAAGKLKGLLEVKDLKADAAGLVQGGPQPFNGSEPVSMNCFGFGADFFKPLEEEFGAFLAAQGKELKSECLIPDVVDSLVRKKKLSVSVLEGSRKWLGVTRPEDKPRVQAEMMQLHRDGTYPL